MGGLLGVLHRAAPLPHDIGSGLVDGEGVVRGHAQGKVGPNKRLPSHGNCSNVTHMLPRYY